MVQKLWEGEVFTLLQKGLQTASLRQRTISHNLANVNTPGFKRSYVQFETVLKEARRAGRMGLDTTRANHIKGSLSSTGETAPQVRTDRTTSMRSDGNNVDVDREMVDLAINQLYYNSLVQRMSGRLSSLRHIITGGRG